jgi:hypothetical protein
LTTADTLLLGGKLLDALRRADRPLSTDELALRMPWKIHRADQGDCAWWCRRRDLPARIHVLECHETWHVVAFQRTSQGFTGIYRHLRSLERRGLIQRCRVDGDRRVFWCVHTRPHRSKTRRKPVGVGATDMSEAGRKFK